MLYLFPRVSIIPADAEKSYAVTLLTWNTIDADSLAALNAATLVNGSDLKTKNFKLVVTDTGCTLKYEAPGLALVVR